MTNCVPHKRTVTAWCTAVLVITGSLLGTGFGAGGAQAAPGTAVQDSTVRNAVIQDTAKAPAHLTVNDESAPLDVTGAPQFGWLPQDTAGNETQTAYQIVVRNALTGAESGDALIGNSSQTDQTFAIVYGVAPASSYPRLGAYIAGQGMKQGPMDVGQLELALVDAGQPAALVKLLTNTAGDGPAKILAEGGTSMWEQWDPGCNAAGGQAGDNDTYNDTECTGAAISQTSSDSFSHGWGSVGTYPVTRGLLGITPTGTGGSTAEVAPPAAGLASASGSVYTERGRVSVSWHRISGTAGQVTLTVTVPDNVQVTVGVPMRRTIRQRLIVLATAMLGIALAVGFGPAGARASVARAGTTAVSGTTATGTAATGTGPAWNQGAVNTIQSTVAVHAPVFAHRTCEVTASRYAGLVRQVTDGPGTPDPAVVWYYGAAINQAIADCHAVGGGVVELPAAGSRNGGGVYYSGAITLLSNVDLRIDTGATVKFVRNPSNAFYPVVLTSYQGYDLYDYSPLVYALNQTDIAVTGGGTLDAQDNVGGGWTLPAARPGAPSGTFAALGQLSYAGTPATQRIFSDDGHLPATIPVVSGCPAQSKDWGPCRSVRNVAPPKGTVAYASAFEPQFVEFNHSANVLVSGIHLVNTLFWEIHPLNSRDVLVRNVTVNDTAHHTDDGVDPESCDDVVIEDDSITVLDDGISVKSGRNADGRNLRAPSENILIKDDTFYNPSGGSASFSVGSEMSGGVRDVYAEDNTSGGDGTAYLLKIKTSSYRGGAVQGVYVRNSTMTQTIRGILNLDTGYSESNPIPDTDRYDPVIRGIYLDNVNTTPTVTTAYPAIVVSNGDARDPFQNVVYENSVFDTPAAFQSAFTGPGAFFSGLAIRDVRFVNPQTGAATAYDSTTPRLLDRTTATTEAAASARGATVPLTAVTAQRPDTVTSLPSDEFTISGRVDLTADPDFLSSGGTVSVYVDRNTAPVPVTVNPDGSFTSAPITLDNSEYWYAGHHYVAVNLANGINVNTTVYQIRVP